MSPASHSLAGRNPTHTPTLLSAAACRATHDSFKLLSALWQYTAELFLDRAPVTVSNFICLAEAGFYNGQHFHRCVPTFMVQAGCPYSRDPWAPETGTGGPSPASLYRLLNTGTIKQRDRNGKLSLLLELNHSVCTMVDWSSRTSD